MALKNDIDGLRAEIEALRRDIASKGEPATVAATPAPAAAAPEADSDLSGMLQSLMSQVGETIGSVSEEVEKHPQASVAAAFGIGIVVGLLIAR